MKINKSPILPPNDKPELLCWRISEEIGEFKSLEKSGMLGFCLHGESNFERRLVDEFVDKTKSKITKLSEHHSFREEIGYYSCYSRCIWIQQTNVDVFENIISSIPMRQNIILINHVSSFGQEPEVISEILSNLNYRVDYAMKDHYIPDEDRKYDALISIQDCPEIKNDQVSVMLKLAFS